MRKGRHQGSWLRAGTRASIIELLKHLRNMRSKRKEERKKMFNKQYIYMNMSLVGRIR
jgi:hypothetical protein